MVGAVQNVGVASGDLDTSAVPLVRACDVREFLRLYEDALELSDARLALFSLPGAATFVSRDPDAVAEEAVRRAGRKLDVYLHIHLHQLPVGNGPQRGNLNTVRAAVGLFSDIDARGPARKKPPETLCPDVPSCIALTEEFNAVYAPLKISVIVGSGFGCYPAILLKEPFVLNSADDKAVLESFGRRFHKALHDIAAKHGWNGAVDYCDPAKVLRLPGCANYKDPNSPRPVRVLAQNDARFTLSDLDEILPQPQKRILVPGTALTPTKTGQTPFTLMNGDDLELLITALREVHPIFGSTWDDERPDLEDRSCSSLDMALADIGVHCGLTDNQIASLLVLHRQKFHRDKQDRRGKRLDDYLRRTISKARAGKQSSATAEAEQAEFDAKLMAAYAVEGEAGTERPAVVVQWPEVQADDVPAVKHDGEDASVEAASTITKATPAEPDSQAPTSSVSIVINPKASPPFEKFDELCSRDAKFRLAWEHGRKDLPDQTQASYDQLLANGAVLQKWTDQEVVDLVLANRRKYGADLNVNESYFFGLIAAAQEHAAPAALDAKLAKLLDLVGGAPGTVTGDGMGEPNVSAGANQGVGGQADSAKREAIVKVLAARLKVPIKRVIKFLGEPGVYRLETDLGEVNLGGVAGLINQSKLRFTVADATGRYIPLIDSEDWPPIAQALLDSCELVDRGTDATLRGTMSEWLRAYLAEKSIHVCLEEADEGREPFWEEGAVVIFTGDFKRWLQVRQNERMTQGRLTADLRAFGAVPGAFKLVSDGRPTTRSAWRLPTGPWVPAKG